jgi:hypothetical protein
VSESLGKAVLDLEANLQPFERNVKSAKQSGNELEHALDAIAAVARVAESQLNQVKLDAATGAKSNEIADRIERSISGVGRAAMEASRHLEQVKLDQSNASETAVAAERMKRSVNDIGDEADRTKRKLEEVKLAGGRNGAGVGPFGSGFGRIGLVGTAVAGGVLTGPAAAPAALGALAAIPALAAVGAGALGTLALAFQGVGKAIGGDKKAYDDLTRSQQQFVLQVRSLDGVLTKLKETAAEAMFPGLTAGLHSALSTGTLNAVTTAVREFGTAIGEAGAAWGRYFGSSEFQSLFGPLMAAGARNLGLMSDAALHLFDAIGVLGRAAIPLTNWMVQGADTASRLAASWLHAKDATGELGRAMDEAKTSMQLVGGLVGSLLRAVGALGEALYPVSKVAVKDLTDGLNSLAGIIHRNQDAIRQIISTALDGLVGVVKAAFEGVGMLRDALGHLVGDKASIVTAILAIGAAMTFAMGPEAATVAGVVLAIGLIKSHWEELAQWFVVFNDKLVLALAEPFSHLSSFLGEWARNVKAVAGLDLQMTQANMSGQHVPVNSPQNPTRNVAADAGGRVFAAGAAVDLKDEQPALLQALSQLSAATGYRFQVTSGFRSSAKQAALYAATVARGTPGIQANGLPVAKPGSSMHEKGAAADVMVIVNGKAVPIAKAIAAAQLSQYGLTSVSGDNVHVQLAGPPTTPQVTIPDITSLFGTVPDFTKNLGPKPPKPTQPTGDALLPQSLRDALQHAKDAATSSQGATAARWLHGEVSLLEKAKQDIADKIDGGAKGKQLAALKNEARSIDGRIADVNRQIATNLRQQAQAVKTEFTSKLSAQRSNIASAMSTLKATLDAQFQQQTQDYVNSVLASKFFQGADEHGAPRRTPLEDQLFGMQQADTAKSLRDALSDAQRQLAQDLGGGDKAVAEAAVNKAQADLDAAKAAGAVAARVAELQDALTDAKRALNDLDGATQARVDADHRAIDQAQRAIDENDLALRATNERQQADHDYAEAVKKYEAERAELERQLNLQLDMFGKGLADGTTQLSDLGTIVDGFGLTLAGDGGVATDFDNLQDATHELARVMLQEASRLAALGDAADAKRLSDQAAALGVSPPAGTVATSADFINSGGAAYVIPGTAAALAAAGRRITHQLPKLDLGGDVMQTGLAIVHRGESYSGVNGEHWNSGGGDVHFHGGTFIGGDKQQVARDLKPYLDRIG